MLSRIRISEMHNYSFTVTNFSILSTWVSILSGCIVVTYATKRRSLASNKKHHHSHS